MFVLPISLQIWVCDQAQFNVEFAKKLLLKDRAMPTILYRKTANHKAQVNNFITKQM